MVFTLSLIYINNIEISLKMGQQTTTLLRASKALPMHLHQNYTITSSPSAYPLLIRQNKTSNQFTLFETIFYEHQQFRTHLQNLLSRKSKIYNKNHNIIGYKQIFTFSDDNMCVQQYSIYLLVPKKAKTLQKYLQEKTSKWTISEPQIWKLLRDVSSGLSLLQQEKINYGIIKPSNIVYQVQQSEIKAKIYDPVIIRQQNQNQRSFTNLEIQVQRKQLKKKLNNQGIQKPIQTQAFESKTNQCNSKTQKQWPNQKRILQLNKNKLKKHLANNLQPYSQQNLVKSNQQNKRNIVFIPPILSPQQQSILKRQMLNYQKYDKYKSDVYVFGCLLMNLCLNYSKISHKYSKQVPNIDHQEYNYKIVDDFLNQIKNSDAFSKQLVKILEKMVCSDSDLRFNWIQLERDLDQLNTKDYNEAKTQRNKKKSSNAKIIIFDQNKIQTHRKSNETTPRTRRLGHGNSKSQLNINFKSSQFLQKLSDSKKIKKNNFNQNWGTNEINHQQINTNFNDSQGLHLNIKQRSNINLSQLQKIAPRQEIYFNNIINTTKNNIHPTNIYSQSQDTVINSLTHNEINKSNNIQQNDFGKNLLSSLKNPLHTISSFQFFRQKKVQPKYEQLNNFQKNILCELPTNQNKTKTSIITNPFEKRFFAFSGKNGVDLISPLKKKQTKEFVKKEFDKKSQTVSIVYKEANSNYIFRDSSLSQSSQARKSQSIEIQSRNSPNSVIIKFQEFPKTQNNIQKRKSLELELEQQKCQNNKRIQPYFWNQSPTKAKKHQIYREEYEKCAQQCLKQKKEEMRKKSDWKKVNFSDGGYYYGTLNANGEKQGYGELTYPDNRFAYIGQWKSDCFYGYGHLFNQNPQPISQVNYHNFNQMGNNWVKFFGNFLMDDKNGLGQIWFTSNERFKGNFSNDMIDGEGIMIIQESIQQESETDRKNTIVIRGLWRNNKLVEIYQ